MNTTESRTYNIEHLSAINAPLEKVYEALTTQEGLAAVWTNDLSVKQKTGEVSEFRFGKDIDQIKIILLDKNKRIEWEVMDSDLEWIGTIISFDLADDKGKTAITLKQEKWRAVTDMFRFCNYNWGFFLYSLKLYCEEGKGIPYQERKF